MESQQDDRLWPARPARRPRYRPAHRCSVRSPTPLCPAIRASGTLPQSADASSRQRVIACSRSPSDDRSGRCESVRLAGHPSTVPPIVIDAHCSATLEMGQSVRLAAAT